MHRNKILLIFVILFLSVLGYVFFAYAGFYNFIGKVNMKSPYATSTLLIENKAQTGDITYLVLGDSLSAGVGSSSLQETFVYQFGQSLSKNHGTVKIINLAQPGGRTEHVIDQLSNAITEEPDYITLLIGVNDIHAKRSLKEFEQNYDFIINSLLTKTSSKIVVINIPYLGDERLVYFPLDIALNIRTQQYNKVIEKLTLGNERIQLVDLYHGIFSAFSKNPDFYAEDLFHPSNKGYLFWATIINAN